MAKSLTVAIVVASTLMLSACNEESAKRVRAEDAVKALMKDSSSAKIEDLQAGKTEKHICGLINAKNSFGAYTGPTPFVYTEFSPNNAFAVILDAPSDVDFRMLKNLFADYGLHQRVEKKCRSVDHMNLGCALRPIEQHPLCKHVTSNNQKALFEALKNF